MGKFVKEDMRDILIDDKKVGVISGNEVTLLKDFRTTEVFEKVIDKFDMDLILKQDFKPSQ